LIILYQYKYRIGHVDRYTSLLCKLIKTEGELRVIWEITSSSHVCQIIIWPKLLWSRQPIWTDAWT